MANAYLIQMQPAKTGKADSFTHARELILQANPAPESLLIFPEMFATGFTTHPTLSDSEKISADAPTFCFLQNLASETKCHVLGGGIENFSSGNFRFRNWTIAFDKNGSPLTIYRKRHPFASEAEEFSAGTEIVNFNWQNFSVFPFICFDLRFPEDFRRARKMGADLITVQAEWPRSRDLHFKTLLRARAIENQCYVLGCGRAGEGFANSAAYDPNGEEIFKADASESVFCVSLFLEKVKEARRNFPLPLPQF